MQRGSQCSHPERPRPDQLLRRHNYRTKQPSETEPNEKGGKGNQNLESPSGVIPVEHLLFGQHIRTQADINTEVRHDVDQNVLLRRLGSAPGHNGFFPIAAYLFIEFPGIQIERP